MEALYPIINIVGPVLLIGFIIFFTVRQWKKRPREDAISEEGARRLREELDEERQTREGGDRIG